jgi:hypothetical protein
MRRILLGIFLVLCVFASRGDAGKKHQKHFYEEQEEIPMDVLKIGPYSNPSETYDYYEIPLCKPPEEQIQHRHKSLRQELEGDKPTSSLYKIFFKVDSQLSELCRLHIGPEEVKQLRSAIGNYYYFEFNFDGLPIRNFLGTLDKSEYPYRYYLFTHFHFTFLYNGNRVIYANCTADMSKIHELMEQDTEDQLRFTYSVQWIPTDVKFEHRMELYKENWFEQELEIHWLSIMNSFILVLLLTGFVAVIIMRVLKSDFSRYARTEGDDEAEDYGWKLVHGDVFRFPSHKMLFCSLVGNGAQYFALTAFLLFLAVVGTFYPGKGSLQVAAIVLYALTAGIAGYTSSTLYRQFGGDKWAWNILLTATIFTMPFFIMAGVVNSIASYYGTTTEISISSIIIILSIWFCVGVPLTVLGGITGKRLAGEFYAPIRTKNFKREIPPIPWYRQAPIQYLMAGFLPFSAIYIELYYVFNSVWGHHQYTLYGVLFLVFLILIIVTACITIALTYFQLSMEDYNWWWRSFVSGGSTGLFIFIYSMFYYLYRSKMSGLLQGGFFFGYMSAVCYFFFLMLGTIGWYSSLVFIRAIYKNLHMD